MQCESHQFKSKAREALDNETLQTALARAKSGFVNKRAKAIELVDDFEHLKQLAQHSKREALTHLPQLLSQFEARVIASGGHVHWASSAEDLNCIALEICQSVQARTVTKGKSMIGEETGLNGYLEQAGLTLVETDLGEYIIQLAKEPPSHIIAPAVHKTRQQVAELFRQHHALGERGLDQISDLVAEARQMLRARFLEADVGITGANLLIADTGSVAVVTNEGNGDLSATLPKVHIVTASIEKVVASLEDAGNILEVLARSATGQAMSTYTTFFTGPRRDSDLDGPEQFHVILLDNGRSDLLGSEFEPMLGCIKCGACLNHCPVYSNVGGHAYGWVYPGPMGSVLTPLLQGLEQSVDLPNASTFCGRCAEVCPMGIPLPSLLRTLREKAFESGHEAGTFRFGIFLYSWLCARPRLYHAAVNGANFVLRHWPNWFRLSLPKGWFQHRTLSTSEPTFMNQWKSTRK